MIEFLLIALGCYLVLRSRLFWLVVLAGLIWSAMPARAQGTPNYNVGTTCQESWPGDAGMQEACLRNQASERHWIENEKVLVDAWRRCRSSTKTDSYSDLATCIRVEKLNTNSAIQPGLPTTFVPADPEADIEKARARTASGYRDPGAIDMCPPPYRMTPMDGCQPRR